MYQARKNEVKGIWKLKSTDIVTHIGGVMGVMKNRTEIFKNHTREYCNKQTYFYGNGPYWTTKYRISSDPPLNACIARLFGKVDVICVSGGVRGCFVGCAVVVEQGLPLLPPLYGR